MEEPKDGQMDRWTNGPMDQWTDGLTDTARSRVACPRLESLSSHMGRNINAKTVQKTFKNDKITMAK